MNYKYYRWDDMMESYFLGLLYWANDFLTFQNRSGWYKHSEKNEDSIYNIPWDTVLSSEDAISPRTR
ncbi:hypothetical protein [Clostridium sp. OS1-26]|uniref:hypothetical protein n=1 Tax=Clostridium sp. OS1-26 TaxID=3070681 RepID=UPI0027E08516|nr:hypothetical protein [Clostridium sp. OS1-26]WML32706.1 hypothetical protein RCG18_15140 [Clostridium sp. OS1-26]